MLKEPEERPLNGFMYELKYTTRNGRRHVATISSLSAGLVSYKVDDKPVVVGFIDNRAFTDVWSGIVLFPWPNRLEGGKYVFEGEEYVSHINEHEYGNQLHAFSQFHDFDLITHSKTTVVLGLRLPPQPEYPFDIYTEVTYKLREAGLLITVESKNVGQKRAPWGIGFHPWFSVRGEYENASLQVNANSIVEVNKRLLPLKEVPVTGDFDLREPTVIGKKRYDHAYVDFFNQHEEPGVVLTCADGHKTLVYADPEDFPTYQICTLSGSTADGPQNTVAIEPTTCYANAFNTGKNLIILEPGRIFVGRWRIDFE